MRLHSPLPFFSLCLVLKYFKIFSIAVNALDSSSDSESEISDTNSMCNNANDTDYEDRENLSSASYDNLTDDEKLRERKKRSRSSSGNTNPNKKPNYGQKYVTSWEAAFKGWLEKSEDGKAFCKFCHITLGPKKSTLQDHAKSKKHKEKCQISDERGMKQTNLDFNSHKDEKFNRLKAEAWAAMFVAAHTSLKSADHLTEGCNGIFKDSRSKIAALLMHRTKCTAVIRNVLAPHFRKKLVRDIGDMPFSLIIDETTDIQTNKVLGIVVRYVDLKLRRVISTFLGKNIF